MSDAVVGRLRDNCAVGWTGAGGFDCQHQETGSRRLRFTLPGWACTTIGWTLEEVPR